MASGCHLFLCVASNSLPWDHERGKASYNNQHAIAWHHPHGSQSTKLYFFGVLIWGHRKKKNGSRHCLPLIIFLLTKFPNTGSTHFSVFLRNGTIVWSTSKLSLAVCLLIIWKLWINLNCLYYLASFLKCTFKHNEYKFKRISMKSSIPSSLSLYLRAW